MPPEIVFFKKRITTYLSHVSVSSFAISQTPSEDLRNVTIFDLALLLYTYVQLTLEQQRLEPCRSIYMWSFFQCISGTFFDICDNLKKLAGQPHSLEI